METTPFSWLIPTSINANLFSLAVELTVSQSGSSPPLHTTHLLCTCVSYSTHLLLLLSLMLMSTPLYMPRLPVRFILPRCIICYPGFKFWFTPVFLGLRRLCGPVHHWAETCPKFLKSGLLLLWFLPTTCPIHAKYITGRSRCINEALSNVYSLMLTLRTSKCKPPHLFKSFKVSLIHWLKINVLQVRLYWCLVFTSKKPSMQTEFPPLHYTLSLLGWQLCGATTAPVSA